jgi:hypothetical protein
MGTREAKITLRTLFFEATQAPGATSNPGIRWYSIAGMSAAATLPSRNRSAQRDGAASDINLHRPRCLPWAKLYHSGAAFR